MRASLSVDEAIARRFTGSMARSRLYSEAAKLLEDNGYQEDGLTEGYRNRRKQDLIPYEHLRDRDLVDDGSFIEEARRQRGLTLLSSRVAAGS